ncbi:MAG: PAS domain-containing protein [Nautiliaceae bacterium]
MTKYSKDELVGAPHSIVRHSFMPEGTFKSMWDTIERGKHFNALVMNLRKDGKHYWVDVYVEPIDKDGNITSESSKIAVTWQSGVNLQEKKWKNILNYIQQ